MDAQQTCTHRYMNKYYTVEDDTSKRGQTHTHKNEKNEKWKTQGVTIPTEQSYQEFCILKNWTYCISTTVFEIV